MYTSTLGSAYGNAQCPPWHPKSGSPTNCPPPRGPKTETTRTPTGDRDRDPGLRLRPNPRPFCPPVCMGRPNAGGRGQKNGSRRHLTQISRGPSTDHRGAQADRRHACRRSAYPRRRSVCTPRGRQRQTPHPAISGVKTRVSGALPLFPYGIRGFSRVAGPEYCWGRDATAARPHPLAKHQPNRVFRRKTAKERLKTRFGAK